MSAAADSTATGHIWCPPANGYLEIHEVVIPHLGRIPVAKGDFIRLPVEVQRMVAHWVEICNPRGIYICDGSEGEAEEITNKLLERGTLRKLTKHKNSYICRTDPRDVARVESKTVICTSEKFKTVPHVAQDAHGILGQWVSPKQLDQELSDRFPGSMAGRLMYIIPFSMGPVGGPLSKAGVQLTDSNYVVLCMRIMTRVSLDLWDVIRNDPKQEFVKCVHSIGCPRPVSYSVINHWPCNPEQTLIAHLPDERMVCSFGSGYGGNSLLGKKCFALRIAGRIAYDEGWLAEHMLIMSVTDPKGNEKFIAAAFPSACGKTNMAMLQPSLPGWKVQVVGDDIAWMRFNSEGQLVAINPECGFFGVAPGTNHHSNPNAMDCLNENTIFTNVAETADGSFFWEGLEDEMPDKNVGITTWLGKDFQIGEKKNAPAAHPNSRFCCPAGQCPVIHPRWEDPAGVPISAIVFGGRRPEGVPLVVEARDWKHGVLLGAQVKSEATAAAEFKGKVIMHDPMAMRPFMGYNFGAYLRHWLDMEKPGHTLPKIFHVNWFRKSAEGKFLWPGFGENIRVIDWICKRVDNEPIGIDTPVGKVPKEGSINFDGLEEPVDWEALFSIPHDYWLEDSKETRAFLEQQTGCDLPEAIHEEILAQEKRLRNNTTE